MLDGGRFIVRVNYMYLEFLAATLVPINPNDISLLVLPGCLAIHAHSVLRVVFLEENVCHCAIIQLQTDFSKKNGDRVLRILIVCTA